MAHRRSLPARLLALLLAAALLGGTAALAAEPQAAPAAAIYTTSDMLGKLYDEDPLTQLAQPAHYGKVAAALADESLPAAALLLDAGNAVYTGLTGDDGSAVAQALRYIGYDALVPGVEEFRLGAGYRASFFADLGDSQGEGAPVDVLAANLLDENGEAAAPYMVYVLDLNGVQVRVGVLGLTDPDMDALLPQRLYGDLRFTHPGNEARSLVREWERYQAKLERECDLTVVVCRGDEVDMAQLAEQTTGIDLLVGGSGTADTGTFWNKDGEAVSYVCGGGAALTCTLLILDETGSPALGRSSLVDLAGYESDRGLAALAAPSAAALERTGGTRTGSLSGQWEADWSLTYQTDTADLVGEALLWASGADAALIAPGALGQFSVARLFARGSRSAPLSLADCAALAPDRSPVVTVELTGAQLARWLEVCAGRWSVTEDGQVSGGEDTCFLYGMDYALYLGSSPGKRLSGPNFQGLPVAEEDTFTVALAASLLSDPEFPRCSVSWSAAADQDFASLGGSTAALLAAYAEDAAHRGRSVSPVRSSTWAVYPEAGGAGLTRLAFVELLYDLAGRPQPGASFAFMDVEGSDAVIWAAERGLVTGNGRGSFLPLDTVDRQQAAVMLFHYAQRIGGAQPAAQDQEALEPLLDGGAISDWARQAVAFCLAHEIMPTAGTRGDLFLPNDSVDRWEAQTCLAALAKYLEQ